AIVALKDAEIVYPMDPDFDGEARQINVKLTVDREARTATVDFTGTSAQRGTNYNAPQPVTMAAVLYVFRLLVADNIPMNEGVLNPITVILPERTMVTPEYPAAVVAGNVEVSQAVTSALLLALGVQAAAQSTMNNVTFGNASYQYYETVCGGSGAGVLAEGSGHPGTGGVHTHMTNSRLTDPEVLEWRFPVVLDEFSIRAGSGGAGLFAGGDGTRRKLRFLEPMTLALLAGHRVVPPPGLGAGAPGALGVCRVQREDGGEEVMASADQVEMGVGDVFWLDTPTGGGFTPE
ncbi:MAG: hydantoinase B/oxoprolinase family protein, partial [Pseudomonadota bacterium]